jgi:hypothetical protein
MVAGRAARDERVLHVPAEHLVDGLHRRTDAAQHDLPGRRFHHGVPAVEIDKTVVGARGLQSVDISVGVHVTRRVEVGELGLLAHQRIELGPVQHRLHRAITVGALGMSVACLVIGEARMVQKQCCHGGNPSSDTVCKA